MSDSLWERFDRLLAHLTGRTGIPFCTCKIARPDPRCWAHDPSPRYSTIAARIPRPPHRRNPPFGTYLSYTVQWRGAYPGYRLLHTGVVWGYNDEAAWTRAAKVGQRIADRYAGAKGTPHKFIRSTVAQPAIPYKPAA